MLLAVGTIIGTLVAESFFAAITVAWLATREEIVSAVATFPWKARDILFHCCASFS